MVVAASVAGCTSGSGKPTPTSSSSAPSPTTAVTTSAPSTPVFTAKPTPTTAKTTPSPARPTVPADVPRTGKNLLTKNEKPPVMPITATAHTAAGAKAFAVFFMRTVDWGYATTNGAYMHHYYQASCTQCEGRYLDLQKNKAARNIYIGDRLVLRSVTDISNRTGMKSGSTRAVRLGLDVSANEILSSHNKFVSGQPAVAGVLFSVYVRATSTAWTVVFADVRQP